MGFIQSTFSLLVGAAGGIYIAQNYDVPNIKNYMQGLMGKAKELDDAYKKPEDGSKNKHPPRRHAAKQSRRLSHSSPAPLAPSPHTFRPPPPPQEGAPRRRSAQHQHQLSHHGDLLLLGGDRAAVAAGPGAGGGPVGAGVLAGLRDRHAQAAGRHRRGGHGGGSELHAAAGGGGGDASRHRALLPAALRHRLRAPLHLHPEQPALDPARLPLHGHRRRLHGGPPRPAGPARRVHRRRVHPRRHRRHHVPARGAPRVPLHAPVHHPRRRHDGRQRHDRHRRHHEEAPRGRQDPEEPRGDGAGAGGDAAAGDGAAGAPVGGAGAVAGDRQRQDGGADRAAGGHDGPHHGRRVAAGGHPAADRGDEHAHGGLHRQQHPLHLPLLAGLLHQDVPARRRRLRRLNSPKNCPLSVFRPTTTNNFVSLQLKQSMCLFGSVATCFPAEFRPSILVAEKKVFAREQ